MSQIDCPGSVDPGGAPEELEPRARRFSLQALLGSALTLCAGLAIAWIDTRPRWDDAGITATALVIAAAAGSLCRVPPWLAALFVAGPLLVAEFPGGPVLLVIPLTPAGAYAGALVRRRIVRS